MQQDNSEMETSHEKEYISNNNYNNYRGLHHRRESLPYRGFALGLFDNLIPRSDKSLGNVCTEELSVDEFSNLVFDTTISNINVKTGDSYTVSYKCNKRLVPKIRSTGDTLTISQSKGANYKRNTTSEITVTIPEGAALNKLSLIPV